MRQSPPSGVPENGGQEILWQDGERVLSRIWRTDANGEPDVVLTVTFATEQPTPANLERLAHEYGLRNDLDAAWAVRPLELKHDGGRALLVLEDPGGEPLERVLGRPLEIGPFLRLAIAISAALARIHWHGLVHKDIKPANILANCADGLTRLTGFGIASRLIRERQALESPEFIAGTLAYMAPEQTGRMNRSIDSRSDLYALGVTLYRMLTGRLPFGAADPMEWVHCHIARSPVPPNERVATIPAVVSAIIMKLLAKAAEDRYQTAAGLEHDLARCLAEWEARAHIEDFALGLQDTPGRLLIPEKLYGRARDVDTLLACFHRVVEHGTTELVLVSGYSGVGKSSVVNEMHKLLVAPRGLFASGKFDQHQSEIPYATFAQAFQGLIHALLGKSEAELSEWRADFLQALGSNGSLVLNLVPELKFIIGEQPAIPDLPPTDAKARFQSVLRRFIGVFAKPEHPLALFLDDLQWLDAATLDLIEDLLTQQDVRHLLLIGAYRNNEVGPSHPLARKLEAIRESGAPISDIILRPLACEDIELLVSDALRSDLGEVKPLARLIHEKTAGNPFFSIQFFSNLAEEALLSFDHARKRWHWDLRKIHAKDHTDNVVDLMVEKLIRLPAKTQMALRQFACIGVSAEFATLSICQEATEDEVHADLWEALSLELVVRLDGSYKFAHDRIQEAAYSLIPEELRAEAHLRIGRLLYTYVPPDKHDDAIFEIVSQLNRGDLSHISASERERIAELNLMAGKRAKASTAYASALRYLTAGAMLLGEEHWDRRHDLVFELELHRAECAFLTGAVSDGAQLLETLSVRAANTPEDSAVACLRVDLYMALDQTEHAIDVCLGYLRKQGIEWSSHPSKEEARREYDRISARLGSLATKSLIDLPLINDATAIASLNVLSRLVPMFTDPNLLSLDICHAVALGLEHGHGDGSCVAYVLLGMLAGSHFGDYQAGYRFARLGYELIEQRGLRRLQAPTYLPFGDRVMPWTQPIRACRDLLHRAFDAASKGGPFTFVVFSFDGLTTNLLAAGDPLQDVQRQAENGLEFAQKARFGLVCDLNAPQLALVRMLRGLNPKFGCLDDEQFDELQIERHFSNNQALAVAECRYWVRKLQARVFAADFAAAIDASARAKRLLWTSIGAFEEAEYEFYGGLARAASFDTAQAEQRQQHFEALAAHHCRLEEWTANCPENFADRAALVGAEIARIQSRDRDAMDLYERAIRSANANGFTHNEALANELAARFYLDRGFDKIAQVYLRDARYGYVRWGADGKVRQLDELYPQLRTEGPPLGPVSTVGPMSTIGAPVEQLDLATVIKVLQAASGEIVPEKFMDTLIRTAIEQAGAERGLLVLARGGDPRIAAEAATCGDAIVVQLRDQSTTADALPESVLHYVMRARESLILDDAATQPPFNADPYIRQRQSRSVICLPLINQAELIGVLYLENSLAPRVFAPGRIAVLKLLASQAAISLENTRLFGDLQQREAKIRRLVESNIIGVLIWDLEGQILEANDEFLRIVGYDRDDLVSGRLSWSAVTPEEWLDWHRRQWTPELRVAGRLQPFEKEYFRKDGSRVPVLVGDASFEASENQGVSFVLDLTERKRGEDALREMQMALSHNNRVATVGQLTASISHEVKQPISAAMTNAQAALRWLSADLPDLIEVRDALRDIVDNNRRAGEIIDGIRALIKREPPRKGRLNINETVRDVIGLVRREAASNGVSIRTQFDNDVPLIEGDRVQLQQVILNLVMNAVEAMSEMSEGAREIVISTRTASTETASTETASTGTASTGTASAGVHVEVRDTGPGLAPNAAEQLFDAFYTTKPTGLGLGLSICRSIVEAHGGLLGASNNVPRGAVFQFTLKDDPGPPA
jgi:PAS domain S-box-containing protein